MVPTTTVFEAKNELDTQRVERNKHSQEQLLKIFFEEPSAIKSQQAHTTSTPI
jgi:hypothetical protein